jgi:SAM-dependent methyltransferase
VELLPHLPGGRSVTTDGQILDFSLLKYQCLDCTLVQSDPSQTHRATTFSYADNYAFYTRPFMREFEKRRYRRYADWVGSFLCRGQARSVLEIGCGEGWVLELLRDAYRSVSFHGVEPSATAAARANAAGLDVRCGYLEASEIEVGSIDFAYSINVIEHVPDPIGFLDQIRRLLAPGGAALVLCPCANVIDPELLFADHLYSYSGENLRGIARRAGFTEMIVQQGVEALYPFQALYCGGPAEIAASADTDSMIRWLPDRALPSARRDYLRYWANLDQLLLERLGNAGNAICFGAGETVDLLRTYAPHAWRRVQALMIDRPPEARPNQADNAAGLPLRFTESGIDETVECILLGVKPRHQRALAARLSSFGKPVISWDDVIREPFA